MSKNKKTFKESMGSVAELFISTPAEQEQTVPPSPADAKTEPAPIAPAADPTQPAPAGWHYEPRLVENKSARLQLLVKPSSVEWLKARAKREGVSLNAMCNIVFEEAIEAAKADKEQ